MPQLALVLLEHLRDRSLVPLVERINLLLRGIIHTLDAYRLTNDEVLGFALVGQEAVEPADREDESDPKLPLDPFCSGGGEKVMYLGLPEAEAGQDVNAVLQGQSKETPPGFHIYRLVSCMMCTVFS